MHQNAVCMCKILSISTMLCRGSPFIANCLFYLQILSYKKEKSDLIYYLLLLELELELDPFFM